MSKQPYITEQEFCKLSKKYTVIPLCTEPFISDSTNPCQAFWNIRSSEDSFLLESVEGEEKVAQYSFVGMGSLLTFISRGESITVIDGVRKQKRTYKSSMTPLDEMRALMKKFSVYPAAFLPRFKGGFVGYIGYEMARYFEPSAFRLYRSSEKNPLDAYFIFPRYVVSFDHRAQMIQLFAFAVVERGTPLKAIKNIYRKETRALRALSKKIIRKTLPELPLSGTPGDDRKQPRSNFSKAAYMKAVRKAKHYIVEGDIIQVVLSQRFEVPYQGDPFTVYRYLRYLNPSPYMYFLKFGGDSVVGASPEMLVRVDGQAVTTCPIAGTRKRGKTDQEEESLQHDLLSDTKERAEHIMLVDLSRNDMGRIARKASVRVSRLMAVEKFSHVMHMVSEVQCDMAAGNDMFSAFKSCFPAGTVTGAPKIRAMQIIEELEPEYRGIYSGSIGYFSFFEELDSCITIRTIVIRGNTAFVQAGAGIVADSVPEREYEETVNKAKAQIYALRMAQQSNRKKKR